MRKNQLISLRQRHFKYTSPVATYFTNSKYCLQFGHRIFSLTRLTLKNKTGNYTYTYRDA